MVPHLKDGDHEVQIRLAYLYFCLCFPAEGIALGQFNDYLSTKVETGSTTRQKL